MIAAMTTAETRPWHAVAADDAIAQLSSSATG
jgi:hypothetical protein